MAPLPEKLGPFELLRRLGAGGMAETFVAVRRGPAGFEQRTCVKRILPAYESDRDFVESFLAEARTSAALRHANIVQVIDFGESAVEGSHYLALELIDGLDLRALVQREDTIDHELVTLIASEVAAALDYAHQGDDDRPSVIHRDVSPSNVLISRAGEIKLTDFGIARVVGGALRTASGVIKGKVPYMPPEYIDGGRFDGRGDLFALGVMMFELLHGYRPFDGESELDTLRRIADGERQPFSAPAPAGLVACIERLIAHDPAQRYPDARTLLDALPTVHVNQTRKRLAELVRARTSRASGEVTPAWSPTPAATPTPRTQPAARATVARSNLPSRNALLALAGASALLVLVVVLAMLKLSREPAPASAAAPSVARVPAALPEVAATPTPPTGVAPGTDAPVVIEPHADADEVDDKPRGHRYAELSVVVLPFGEVWIDGKLAGESPLRNFRLPAGSHEIAVGEGRAREKKRVRLAPGQREELVFSTNPR